MILQRIFWTWFHLVQPPSQYIFFTFVIAHCSCNVSEGRFLGPRRDKLHTARELSQISWLGLQNVTGRTQEPKSLCAKILEKGISRVFAYPQWRKLTNAHTSQNFSWAGQTGGGWRGVWVEMVRGKESRRKRHYLQNSPEHGPEQKEPSVPS